MAPIWRYSVVYRTRTLQGAAHVTLNTKMMSTSVRTGGLPRSHRNPSRMGCGVTPGSASARGGIGRAHHHGQECAARRIGEHFGGAVQEGRRQDEPDRCVARDEEDDEGSD